MQKDRLLTKEDKDKVWDSKKKRFGYLHRLLKAQDAKSTQAERRAIGERLETLLGHPTGRTRGTVHEETWLIDEIGEEVLYDAIAKLRRGKRP